MRTFCLFRPEDTSRAFHTFRTTEAEKARQHAQGMANQMKTRVILGDGPGVQDLEYFDPEVKTSKISERAPKGS